MSMDQKIRNKKSPEKFGATLKIKSHYKIPRCFLNSFIFENFLNPKMKNKIATATSPIKETKKPKPINSNTPSNNPERFKLSPILAPSKFIAPILNRKSPIIKYKPRKLK